MLKRNKLFFSVLLAVIVIDQFSKWSAAQAGEVSFNSGISLGLFSVISPTLLTVILAAVLFLVWWIYRAEWQSAPVISGIFFGGGISNLIDRVVYGSVRDWLPVPYLNIFNNLADYAIALGLLLIVIHSVRKNYKVDIEEAPVNRDPDTAE